MPLSKSKKSKLNPNLIISIIINISLKGKIAAPAELFKLNIIKITISKSANITIIISYLGIILPYYF